MIGYSCVKEMQDTWLLYMSDMSLMNETLIREDCSRNTSLGKTRTEVHKTLRIPLKVFTNSSMFERYEKVTKMTSITKQLVHQRHNTQTKCINQTKLASRETMRLNKNTLTSSTIHDITVVVSTS